MFVRVLLSLIIFSSNGVAASEKHQTYFQHENNSVRKYEVKWNDKIRMSSFCFKKNKACSASTAMKSVELPNLETAFDGFTKGSNVILCRNMRSESIILKDLRMSQHLFCRFKDGSVISADDLIVKMTRSAVSR